MVAPDRTPAVPLLVTVEEAAELLRLGRTRMYELVMSGQVVSVKVGRRRLIPRKGLEEFVDGLIGDELSA